MKNVKQITATFFITLILLFKVAGLHALSHHADEHEAQHCEVCDIVTAVNFTPHLETEALNVPKVQFFFCEKAFTKPAVKTGFSNRYLDSYLFARPPPQLQ
ncbi:hypothetical protein GCM10022291_06000 [Postechiella marina]|uniref:Uncharacterized protein n=1 Tax=Postechiella marina TaxID=943941 RepID=A0ABP8C2J6_9FLAO